MLKCGQLDCIFILKMTKIEKKKTRSHGKAYSKKSKKYFWKHALETYSNKKEVSTSKLSSCH